VRRRALLAVALAALTGCADDGGSDGGKPLVVATTSHVADIARNVAGDRAEVRQILQPGADPHEYEPRPSDARALADADLVVSSGGDVDEWLADLLDQSGGDAATLTLIDAVDAEGDDPHWWQDPRNAVAAAGAISDRLGGSGADRYIARLRRLDADVEKCVAKLPEERRKLVTSHDSLGYYARRYGFTVVGAAIPSLSSQAEPSAASVERLVDQIEEEDVPAIFPESSVDPRLERAIAREADAEVAPPLYTDALGPTGSPGATYVGAMESNTRTIVEALSGGRAKCAF
jgi:ABC-type Zn uptake system ZnuABC Zn-binding protein ZnuA